MAIDLHRLDRIQDYDLAIASLEGFVEELAIEFVAADEGKAYLKAHPIMKEYVGSWIEHLLYFGYVYESVTLPNMTINNIEVVVAQTFPNKITLFDPAEAETIIPELKAFWQWLKREYNHPHAHKIIKFLNQLQPRFIEMMNDPHNFGIAKSFLMSGMAAGFDMTSEAGIRQFQQQRDRELATDGKDSADLNSLLSDLTISGSDLLSPTEQIQLEHNLKELATEVLTAFPMEIPSAKEFQLQLQGNMTQQLVQKMPELSKQAVSILKKQQISAVSPGTILQDFKSLLDFVGNEGISVSGKRHLIPMKRLGEFNQQLAEPLDIDLQRPQQKSYPSINGLYLLLRATGMGKILRQGKKAKLTLDSEMVEQWLEMNPVEQYLNLFEAWLIVANEEILGERPSYMNEGFKCLQYWLRMPPEGQKVPDYRTQENLRYYPEFHNLALMKLFGLVEANYGQPQKGKGWRVESVTQTAWGKALIQAAFRTQENTAMWVEETAEDLQFGHLQPILQPYFPEWRKAIALPKANSTTGVYVFKVIWHQIWRRIAISSEMTLWDLSQLILRSVDFDADHLDRFSYKNRLGKTVKISHPYLEESPNTEEVKIGDLPLEVGSMVEYLFDFGDCWEFQLQLEEIRSDVRPDYGEVVASHGEAPPQYPDWGEEY